MQMLENENTEKTLYNMKITIRYKMSIHLLIEKRKMRKVKSFNYPGQRILKLNKNTTQGKQTAHFI